MGFVTEYVDGRYVPRIRCDYCGEFVEHSGIVMYQINTETGEVVTPNLIMHARTEHPNCNRVYERANPAPPGRRWYSEQLQTYLVYIEHNAKLDLEHARELAALTEITVSHSSAPHSQRGGCGER